jgi:hypothetical protein
MRKLILVSLVLFQIALPVANSPSGGGQPTSKPREGCQLAHGPYIFPNGGSLQLAHGPYIFPTGGSISSGSGGGSKLA